MSCGTGGFTSLVLMLVLLLLPKTANAAHIPAFAPVVYYDRVRNVTELKC